jgi:hypothetical protein
MGVSVVSCWQRHDVSILPAGEVELGRCLGRLVLLALLDQLGAPQGDEGFSPAAS